jgi:hypothetical protein
MAAFASPYIKTEAAQVTRVADSAVMTGVNFSSWFNPSEGTLFAEAAWTGGSDIVTSNRVAVSISDNTSSNRIFIYNRSATAGGALVTVSGATQAAIDGVATTADYVKSALTIKTNDVNLSANGAAVTTDTSCLIPVVSQMNIGSASSGLQLNGYIKRLTYYNQALTSANLQAVTR